MKLAIPIRDYFRLAFIFLSSFIIAIIAARQTPWIISGLLHILGADDTPTPRTFSTLLPFALTGAFLAAFFSNAMLRLLEEIQRRWENMDGGDKVTLFLGIFAGLVASFPFLLLFNTLKIPSVYTPLLFSGLTLGFAAVSVYALQSMDDMLPWTKVRGKGRRTGIKILDTNVVIDGRIYEVARSGFLDGQIYVPGFVLEELQFIADSHDALRRQRGRRGLEVLRHMQTDFPLEIRIHDKLAPDLKDGVDARLVRLAKALGGDIVTNDFNLNRVAVLQDVKVLNLNDLSLALRPNVLPQERMTLLISREGNQPGQGVGYLDDGTMVVIENGRELIGQTVEVTITQVIQTERGKMIFGEFQTEEDTSHPH